MNADQIRGALLASAFGDSLGMPIEGISHQNVRTYYKGIKTFRDDEKREDLTAGQWTDDTQFTFAVARAIAQNDDPERWPEALEAEYLALRPDARRWGPTSRAAIDRMAGEEVEQSEPQPTNGAPMRAAAFGVWWAATEATFEEAASAILPALDLTHQHPRSLAAGLAQAWAVRKALVSRPETFDGTSFFDQLVETTRQCEEHTGADDALSARLEKLRPELDGFPLDLAEICEGTSYLVSESWPYAVAMFARNPALSQASLLSAINVGGDADTIGAMIGALLGALNGLTAYPEEWLDTIEECDRLLREADALTERLIG